MIKKVEIYGTTITLPEVNDSTYIEKWNTENHKEQYWHRYDLPDYFEEVEYDKDGNAILTHQQKIYAIEEVRRCKQGFWFMNNGILTYITGKNYFYLKWWKLENDVYPDYRDTDRRYFLFLNHWENISHCLGIVRGKKRREGATSQATSNLIYECIFFRNSFCGLTSKTEKDAKAAFTTMVAFGYRQLPVFLKPKQLNNKDSVTELIFAHKSVTTKDAKGFTIDSDTGHRSKVDYRAPGKNSYDSGRLSRLLADEAGKWPVEVPASEFLAIVSKTMIRGVKKVGFCEFPSTVNELTKGGGSEFKKIWDLADVKKYGDRTPNRMARYFTPAFDGYEGFIDRYGMSVINEPNEDQYKFLVENYVGVGDLLESDVKLGAKEYLLSKRSGLEGTSLEEEIRMNPFDEKEMFMSTLIGCLFNSVRLREQEDWLTWNTNLIERGNLIWENGHEYYITEKKEDGIIEIIPNRLLWVVNPNGRYEKVVGWMPKEANKVNFRNGHFYPTGNYAIRIGNDPVKFDKTKDNRRSNCVAYAYQMEDTFNTANPFNDMFVMRYAGREVTTDMSNEAVLKMAWFCNTQALIERNIGLDPKKFYQSKKCHGFLMYLPGEVEYGVYTDGAGKVVNSICGYTESYVETNVNKVYFAELLSEKSGWLGFDVKDTQKYDDCMAGGFALIAAKNKKYSLPQENKKGIESIMPLYKAV